MTAHTRILGIAVCLLLASGQGSPAAAKRKAGGNGKSSTHSRMPRPAPSGTVDPVPTKNGSAPAEVRASEKATPGRESVRQESRIEFDERMLRGQSAAGVIYLFQRTPSDWKSIVEVPESFRARTVLTLTPVEERK